MKRAIKLMIPVLLLMFVLIQGAVADSIDSYLNDYEKFVIRVEKYADNKQYDMLDKVYADQGKFNKRKEKLNVSAADWSFRQSGKLAGFSARYGVAVGVLNTQKGLDKTQEKLDDNKKSNKAKEA